MEVSNPSILPSDPGVGNGSLVSSACEWLHGETGLPYSYRRFSELMLLMYSLTVCLLSAWMSDHYTHTTSKRTYDLMGIRYSSSSRVDPRVGDMTEETPVPIQISLTSESQPHRHIYKAQVRSITMVVQSIKYDLNFWVLVNVSCSLSYVEYACPD